MLYSKFNNTLWIWIWLFFKKELTFCLLLSIDFYSQLFSCSHVFPLVMSLRIFIFCFHLRAWVREGMHSFCCFWRLMQKMHREDWVWLWCRVTAHIASEPGSQVLQIGANLEVSTKNDGLPYARDLWSFWF